MEVGEPKPLKRPDHAVVHASLKNDACGSALGAEQFVQPGGANEVLGSGPAVFNLVLLLCIGHRRQHHAPEILARVCQRIPHGERRRHVVARLELTGHMTGPDPHHQHHRRARCLGQVESLLHRLHHRLQVGARVQQPELRLHGEGVAALLHDRGAFAVILADDDQRPAIDAGGGQVRQRVRGNVHPDRALVGHCAADRIMHRSRQHRGRRRFRGVCLETHPELRQQFLRIGKHVHQVRDGRSLVAADIAHA